MATSTIFLNVLSFLLKFFCARSHYFANFQSVLAQNHHLNTSQNDIMLWESFRKGDREAFATLFRNYYEALCRFGGKFTSDHQLLEDSIQELFIELWKSNSRNAVVSVRSYLLKSLKYKLLRAASKKRDTVLAVEGDLAFEWSHETFLIATQEHEEKRQKVLNAVAQCRLGNAQRPAGSREPAAIDHLHEEEEVVQIEHASPIVQMLGR